MKHSSRYEIDFTESMIIATKGFLKEAGIIGSTAYCELAQVRRDYPGFPIVQREISKKQNKRTYSNLTYERMVEFIKSLEDGEGKASTALQEFERVRMLAKETRGRYAFVKSWFLKRYRDQIKTDNRTIEPAS